MRTLVMALLLAGCGGSEPLPGNPDMAQAGIQDLAGGKPFGAACTMDGECATGHCFVGMMQSFCTMPCTAATQATDCPNPPTSGTCNMRGFCKP
jgi:hypothetical protein